jgi:cytochrome c-type biogenesis protein CcmH
MATFVVVAAFMAALAAAAVAVPLLRHRSSRLVGVIAGVLVAGAAAALYPLWSNWNWHGGAGAAAAAPDVSAMVAKLEKHLSDNPDDAAGWLMLGRSYLALERLDDAVVAYDHAHRLDAANVEAALGLGEAMSLRAGGNITPDSANLFEQALAQQPDNPKALLYGGFGAAARGDFAAARSRWQALKDMHPPAQIEQLLDARIAELGPAPAGTAAALAPVGGAMAQSTPGTLTGVSAAAAGTAGAAASGGGPAADVTVNISIAPTLKARLTREAPLFVFAREPGVPGPPLAAKRLTSAAIGTQIHLSAADSMMPGRVLVNGHNVSITARVSFSGQPLPAAGDLYGELAYDVGHDGARDLVIDRVAE